MPRYTTAQDIAVPVHLLLCGDSKSGKSHYVAKAIIDGFICLYVDADNGAATVRDVFARENVGPDVLNRFIHIPCQKGIYDFLKEFTEKNKIQWNLTRDIPWNKLKCDPTDNIVEIHPAKIPRGVIVVFDSWTSVYLACMRTSATNNSVRLESMGLAQTKVYQEAGIRLTQHLDILQVLNAHVIIPAHGQFYERQERPPGIAEDTKMKDMLIKETIQIPASCSKPHGYQMPKYFNQVGWLVTDRAGRQQLDFRRQYDRVGGGSVNAIGDPNKEFSFKALWDLTPAVLSEEEISQWYKEYPASEIVEAAPVATPQKPAVATPSTPAASIPGATTASNPLAMMMQKRN